MGEYQAEGCSDMILYFYDMGRHDSLEVFASEVMPQLRTGLTSMQRMLAPSSIAIVGTLQRSLQARRSGAGQPPEAGVPGPLVGVNPRSPRSRRMEVVARLGGSHRSARPGRVCCSCIVDPGVVAESAGAGGVVVLAGGFAEAGEPTVQPSSSTSWRRRRRAGVPVLGPNSGGIIRPAAGLAASFLTCLDRPAEQIRSGPVGLVTQSGGTGSYVHNLAAGAGSGLAASISTGNEAVLGIADGIGACASCQRFASSLLCSRRSGTGLAFLEAVEAARRAGKAVVACRIGSSRRGAPPDGHPHRCDGRAGTRCSMACSMRRRDRRRDSRGDAGGRRGARAVSTRSVASRSGS